MSKWNPPPLGKRPRGGDRNAPISRELAAWYAAKWHREELDSLVMHLSALPPQERDWVYRSAIMKARLT